MEKAVDNLIYKYAYDYAANRADGICGLICEKQELSHLWAYINGVLGGLCDEERAVLKYYAGLRQGLKQAGNKRLNEIKRAAMKFSRRLRRFESFKSAYAVAEKYKCLINEG